MIVVLTHHLNGWVQARFLGEDGKSSASAATDPKLGAYPLTQKQRWTVIKHAMAWDVPQREAWLAAEAVRDPSDSGALAVLAAKTCAWDAKVKADAW